MLFEIFFFVLLILLPITGLWGFFFGFRCGLESAKKGEISVNLPLINKNNDVTNPETENERLQRIITQNIENYGTDIPQMDVV